MHSFLFFFLSACTFSSLDKPPQRDVILIVVDTLRADRVGIYGNTTNDTTPNIDNLARSGMMFWQGYAQSDGHCPLCFAVYGTLSF